MQSNSLEWEGKQKAPREKCLVEFALLFEVPCDLHLKEMFALIETMYIIYSENEINSTDQCSNAIAHLLAVVVGHYFIRTKRITIRRHNDFAKNFRL